MQRKKLNRELLSNLIIGETESDLNLEILDTEEVKSLMYHQWKNPNEVGVSHKPDFEFIFNKIKERTQPEKALKSANSQYLIHEIDDLKTQYKSLKKRFRFSISIAATVILLITFGALSIIRSNKVFQKTFTENIAPSGHKSQVILPDGTKAFLNSGTILRYDNFFGKKYRNIELVGEAFFEVQKNKKLPFVIVTEDVTVKVIGTKFNIMAYPDDEYIETTVTEGRVSVTENHNKSSLLLTANQKATFDRNTNELLLDNINPEPYISWKEDVLTFDNENFTNVIKKLERWYNVSIHVEGKDSISDRYTLTIKTESLHEVLELIRLTTSIEYTIEGNEVLINYR